MVIKCTYKNKELKCLSKVITQDDIIFELETDVKITGFLYITYSNNTQRTIELVTIAGDLYRGRFKLYNNDISNLAGTAKLTLVISNGILKVISNSVPLTFSIPDIKTLIKLDSNKEIIDIKKDLDALKNQLFDMSNNRTFSTLKVCNPEHAEPGMIPVIINKQGAYMLKHPFMNIIESVNKKYPDKGNVTLTTDDIHVANKTLTEYLSQTNELISRLKRYNDTLTVNLSKLEDKLIELEIKLQKHLSNPII